MHGTQERRSPTLVIIPDAPRTGGMIKQIGRRDDAELEWSDADLDDFETHFLDKTLPSAPRDDGTTSSSLDLLP